MTYEQFYRFNATANELWRSNDEIDYLTKLSSMLQEMDYKTEGVEVQTLVEQATCLLDKAVHIVQAVQFKEASKDILYSESGQKVWL